MEGYEQAPGRRRADTPARPDGQRAGRDILGVLQPEEMPQPAVWVDPPTPAPVHPERMAAQVGASTSVDFPPKRGVRRLLGAAFLMVLTATGGAAYAVSVNSNKLTISVAVTMGVLLLLTWAIRAGTPLTHLSVQGGQLDIRSGGRHLKFDLSSRYTAIEVNGAPGRPGWKVVFGPESAEPFVVDSSIVDAAHFMEVLRLYRKE